MIVKRFDKNDSAVVKDVMNMACPARFSAMSILSDTLILPWIPSSMKASKRTKRSSTPMPRIMYTDMTFRMPRRTFPISKL